MSPSKRRCVVWDFAERAGWTAAQQFVAVLLATTGRVAIIDLPWRLALATSAGAAIASMLTTAVQYMSRLTNSKPSGKPPSILRIRLAKTRWRQSANVRKWCTCAATLDRLGVAGQGRAHPRRLRSFQLLPVDSNSSVGLVRLSA